MRPPKLSVNTLNPGDQPLLLNTLLSPPVSETVGSSTNGKAESATDANHAASRPTVISDAFTDLSPRTTSGFAGHALRRLSVGRILDRHPRQVGDERSQHSRPD